MRSVTRLHRMLGLAASLIAMPLAAQTTALPTIAPIAAPPLPAGTIDLNTGSVAGSTASESWMRFAGQTRVRNVQAATLTPVLPPKGKANGSAVIIAPGGGFLMLSMDSEGWPVARWLAAHGVTAFVLKYRLKPTPADLGGFQQQLMAMFMQAAQAKDGGRAMTPPEAVADGIAALKLVRSRSTEWGIDPHRVGFLGFSAGAMTALAVTLSPESGSPPDFVAPIYGSMDPVDVPANAPPMFAAEAIDDPLFGSHGFGLVESWRKAGKGVELHVYQHGGHGFGMGLPGTTSTGWIDAFYAWMGANNLLARSK